MNVITMSGVMVTLFLGGPQGLFDIPVIPGYIEGSIWFVAKLLLFLYMFVWFRATLPRLRYDQLMDFGWKILIPVSLGWFLLLAALRQFANGDNVASLRVVGIAGIIGAVAIGLFAVFTVMIAAKLRKGEHPPCACFGAWSAKPIGGGHIARNLALIAVAVVAAL